MSRLEEEREAVAKRRLKETEWRERLEIEHAEDATDALGASVFWQVRRKKPLCSIHIFCTHSIL